MQQLYYHIQTDLYIFLICIKKNGLQFLLDHNFESTAEALVQEASKMGFQTLEHKLKEVTDPYVQLMLCYNIGDYSTFFQVKIYL